MTSRELSDLPRRRSLINSATSGVVAMGGAAVIGAIALIFFYLLWVIAPIFESAELTPGEVLDVPAAPALRMEISESGEFASRVTADGQVQFFALAEGDNRFVATHDLNGAPAAVRSLVPRASQFLVVDDAGDAEILGTAYPVSFDGDERKVTPQVVYPFEDTILEIGEARDFEFYHEEDEALLVVLRDDIVELFHYRDVEEGYALDFPRTSEIELETEYQRAWIGPRARWLFLLAEDGRLDLYDISRPNRPKFLSTAQLVPEGETITAAEPLLGRYSLLIANGRKVVQWFVIRDDYGYRFEPIREFDFPGTIRKILSEHRRKGFIAIDAEGVAHLAYATSHVVLASEEVGAPDQVFAISPRGKQLITQGDKTSPRLHTIDNEHPDITWGSLWQRVWYEGYPEEIFSWQSSSADNDFEPKFSLVPLLFGTLKAAFYAMLLATPLALMGAIYTAYFMAPAMRRLVKPGIEIMAALPTVVLGFLAGLWLAPIVEANLSAVITIFLVLPVGLMLLAWGWSLLPERLTRRFDGWYALIAVVPIVLMVVVAFQFGPFLEQQFFGGNSRAWFLNELGLSYDQRNALVVGLAMGLAVTPAIFSIAEDAIYGVPQHLINGSLALGATPWQTLIRVVLLTASPGMFSAVMIGLGRAVGETMIVLMATGNTPIMDLNLFEGMRTFAANIAVELPESEVGSSHYRILFLTAMVLFILTFIFNTAAEVVRQRLRVRYGSL